MINLLEPSRHGQLLCFFIVSWILVACLVHLFVLPVSAYFDTTVYQSMADQGVSRPEFWTSPDRPQGYSLALYALNDGALVVVQYMIFAIALAGVVIAHHRDVGAVFTLAVVALTCTTQYLHWSSAILTESFSMSLFCILFLCVRLEEVKNNRTFAGLLLMLAFWGLLRDTNFLFALGMCIAIGTGVALRLLNGSFLKRAVPLLLTGLVLACIYLIGNTDERAQFPMVNNIGLRILTDESATSFFHERGMPLTPEVLCHRNKAAYECGDFKRTFGDFLSSGKATQTYASWMLSSLPDRSVEFGRFLLTFYPPVYPDYSGISQKMEIFQGFNFSRWAIAVILLFALATDVLSFGFSAAVRRLVVMKVGLLGCGFISYWADGIELQRHILPYQFGLAITSILSLGYGLRIIASGEPWKFLRARFRSLRQ